MTSTNSEFFDEILDRDWICVNCARHGDAGDAKFYVLGKIFCTLKCFEAFDCERRKANEAKMKEKKTG